MPYEGIRVAGTLWSSSSHAVKDFLSRNRIPYLWQDIEHNAEARELVEAIPPEKRRLPVVFFPNGDMLIQPDNRLLAEKIGMQTQATQPYFDLIIVGAGPAGLGAAVYGGSEGLRTALIEREATGGQAGTSSRIENYLGFPRGLSGADLARRATAQASRFGVEILTTQEVTKVRVDELYRIAVLEDGSELSCKAMVIASGVTTRTLDAPGVEKLTGAGIYYGAALTEAAHYRGRHIFVVGGANSAGQGAVFFSRYAKQVTMLGRGSALSRSMSHYLINQIAETPNIEVCVETEVVEAHGDNRLEAITTIDRKSGETQKRPADALFAFVGAAAHTDMVAGVVERNSAGFILTGPDLIREGKKPAGWVLKRDPYLLETSVPGIFAAGDVRQGAIRRVASAVGEGAVAVSFVHQYLNTV
jgi:thioredoxin reductase (NADPH)